jgi:hypothetical protein
MGRTDRVSALVLLAFAAGYLAVGWQYPYWGDTGPASGFMPRWLGLVLAVLTLLLYAGARGAPEGRTWLPAGRGLLRLLVVLGASVALVALLPVLGMTLGAGLFLLAILRFLEGFGWGLALGVAAATAVVNYLVFTRWLQVPFPVGILGF